MSFRLVIKIAALASTCWLSIGSALAEHRIALVIGNANYATATSLPNPANDARAMTDFLDAAGFQVLQAPDLKQSDMLRTVGNFARLVAEKGPDTVALVFYAGHGLQVDGENYLVPVDAAILREQDIPLQAMRLGDLMTALSSVPTKALIVMLDACRNNPFAEVKNTGGRGLAMVDAPSGSLISYATAPGTEARDGDRDNSPYTAAVLKIAREEDLPIEQALKRVRLAVNEATGKQQLPWESSSLTTDFSFFPRGGVSGGGTILASASATPAAAEARSQTRSVGAWQKELETLSPRKAYESVIREDKVEAYQAYLLAFPSDELAADVRRILERREEMIAWNAAVSVNSPESYQAFLARHGGSDYAEVAERLKQHPRPKRPGLALAVGLTRATVASTSAVAVDAPPPPYVPPFQFHRYWRFHRPSHDGKPMGAGGHDKAGKIAKPARTPRLARLDNPKPVKAPKFVKAPPSVPRNILANRQVTMNRAQAFNRPPANVPRPSFVHMGGGGGHGGRH